MALRCTNKIRSQAKYAHTRPVPDATTTSRYGAVGRQQKNARKFPRTVSSLKARYLFAAMNLTIYNAVILSQQCLIPPAISKISERRDEDRTHAYICAQCPKIYGTERPERIYTCSQANKLSLLMPCHARIKDHRRVTMHVNMTTPDARSSLMKVGSDY